MSKRLDTLVLDVFLKDNPRRWVMCAPLRTISAYYNLHQLAEERIIDHFDNVVESMPLHGNGKFSDVILQLPQIVGHPGSR